MLVLSLVDWFQVMQKQYVMTTLADSGNLCKFALIASGWLKVASFKIIYWNNPASRSRVQGREIIMFFTIC